jgi:hypothetical protein
VTALVRRLRTAARLAEAGFWMLVAWIAFDVFRTRSSFRLLPPPQSVTAAETAPSSSADPRLSQVVNAIRYMAHRLPFPCVCLHKGIAADRMLRRRGMPSCMHYGMNRGQQGWQSHIWVTSAGHPVVGVAEAVPFTEVVRFTA